MVDYIKENRGPTDQYDLVENMDEKASLLSEISRLTETIKTDYPGIYQFLNENPMTIPLSAHPRMDENTLRSYLNDLKAILKNYTESNKAAKK